MTLLDGQVEAAQEAVSDAVAAAEDDPSPPRPQHQQAAQLPETGPLRAALLALAAGPWRDQPDQQPIQQGWNPEGEDGSGVHADRARQQRLSGRWPGLGWVVPGPR